MDINDHSESEDANGEGDGVWSPDIEQCFREALLLYPPCGRRKHILQEEGGGKMYGRNELIARYIMLRTGKSRTRKQVSSHIQVLARRKAKAEATPSSSSSGVSPSPSAIVVGRTTVQCVGQLELEQSSNNNNNNQPTNNTHNNQITAPSRISAYHDVWVDRPIVSQRIRLVEFSAFIEHRNPPPLDDMQALSIDHYSAATTTTTTPNRLPAPPLANSNNQLPPPPPPLHLNHQHQLINQQHSQNSYKSSHATLTSAPVRHCYIQIDYSQPGERFLGKQQLEQIDISQIQDKFPNIGGPAGLIHRAPNDAFFLVKFWADISGPFSELAADDQNSYFGFSTTFETLEHHKDITCSTKACSYGLQVVEKVDKMYGAFNSSNGRYSYTIESSPMCDFMSKFIRKLRQLPRLSQMNSVLENFTVLQVISSESTSQILLCLAYVFEVASTENHSLHHQPQTLNSNQLQPTTRTPYHGPQYHVYKLTKDKAFLQ